MDNQDTIDFETTQEDWEDIKKQLDTKEGRFFFIKDTALNIKHIVGFYVQD